MTSGRVVLLICSLTTLELTIGASRSIAEGTDRLWRIYDKTCSESLSAARGPKFDSASYAIEWAFDSELTEQAIPANTILCGRDGASWFSYMDASGTVIRNAATAIYQEAIRDTGLPNLRKIESGTQRTELSW